MTAPVLTQPAREPRRPAQRQVARPQPADYQREAKLLATELRTRLRGDVRFDDGSRALYATDSSNYRQVPVGVVIPKTIDDVIRTVAACHGYGVPVLMRGG